MATIPSTTNVDANDKPYSYSLLLHFLDDFCHDPIMKKHMLTHYLDSAK